MAQDIYQWIFAKLNTDTVLATMWAKPAENPYSITAGQSLTAIGPLPYCTFQLLQRKARPIYGNAMGPGNTWVFSFAFYATGSATASGAKQVRAMAERLVAIFRAQSDPIGVQACYLESQTEHWLEIERVYRVILDFEIVETLACLP